MKGLGSGECGEFTFMDYIGLVSFFIGFENLDLNITQEDMDKQTADLDAHVNAELNRVLTEIHKHLEVQDDKIDTILSMLEGKK